MTVTTMTSKGQVTIPKRMRVAAGLKPGSKVEFDITGDGIVLKPAAKARPKSRFAKVLGTVKSDMTTDEIMKLLRGDPDEDPGLRG